MLPSSRPYLIRALYDWIVDCELTPYVVLDTSHEDVNVPEEYIEGSRIVLNISPQACRGLILENDRVILTTRFSGVPTQLSFSPDAVLAIYAKENGRGMVFSEHGADGNTGSTDDEPHVSSETLWDGGSELDEALTESDEEHERAAAAKKQSLELEVNNNFDQSAKVEHKKKASTKKPFLKVVK